MRIRLRIERNELPPVAILWTFSETQLSETIAQFMERVNERFPLEGNTWGFEDYAVSLGGYEAQHYCEVGDAFEKDDEVVIRPLLFKEKRARTITGRDQISGDGRHLIDGVAFGRPLLKRVVRPDINIPPRKRQKLDSGSEDNALVRFEDVDSGDDDDGDDDDEEDGDFEDEDGSLDGRAVAEDAVSASMRKSAEDEIGDSGDDEEHDDGEGDARFGANATGDTAEDLSEGSSEEDSDSDSDNDSSSSSSSESSSDDSSSDDSSHDASSSVPVKPLSAFAESLPSAPSANNGKQKSLPHEGGKRTRARNVRRREAKRLNYLKEAGCLPGNASFDDMDAWLKINPMPSKLIADRALNNEMLERKRQQLLIDIAGGGVDVDSPNDQLRVDLATAVEEQPPTRVEEGEIWEGPEDERPEDLPTSPEPITQNKATSKFSRKHDRKPAPTSPRARINLAASNRLVFGSLGVRTPKTQAEKDALKEKLAARHTKVVVPPILPTLVETPAEEDVEPDAWQEKVTISAVECVDEGVVLSAPPFPFEQRWDPQYAKKRTRNSALYNAGKRSKKRKRNDGGEDFVETYDKYNQDGGGDALNYDDEEEELEDDEYWEEGALLDGDEEESDGFPPLPEDTSTLESLAESDAAVGDYIIYTEMACSAATSWAPQMLSQRAKVDSKDEIDGSWRLLLPQQRKATQYDEDGNRLYEKFEMEGFNEDDEGEKNVLWSELMDVKLLQRGEGVVEVA
ncbi:uncharacterized protein MYCGRDRAFT_109018 [Zymoseptoria tritici IPO323]|uniref:DUF7357 domain-containing protein n=2 Tax=Zymoseptoria tritici TaxID=1047171 RepID=F9X896_ZYMTI|nr:uncharacterized protein MYCGRDRAFT_109018 [Zymoseptoria tritici IPO323]EGP88488.1 hypothetical protein MYCGRDRAFT_109018 [Zymoseptoria tritici IPO323]